MTDQPADPMTMLAAGAHQTHELYSAYVEAGFTPEQAMQLTIALIVNAVQHGQ